VRRDLRERLRALQRSGPGCPPPAEAETETETEIGPGAGALPRFRAVALPDEVLLLACRPGGGDLARRTPLPRAELLATLDRLGEALERPGTGDEAWRRAAEPLAAALLPPRLDALPEITAYSLHGPLQGAPLAALPLPAGGWLADRTTVALLPAGTATGPAGAAAAVETAEPLFVVDPLGDLAGAGSLMATYRKLFPGARLLVGEAADRQALRRELAGARFLHVDAHGSFVPAFPELSGLELADGRLSLIELAELPVAGRFANLSGCQTGRWPITADSGRYGLGGLLARLGAGWVIASRADLDDDLARDFNAAFYRAVAGGAPPEAAYRQALARVAARHPAASWGALLLRRGAGAPTLAAASTP
jgi:CHAT domain-containing protein